MSEFFDAVVVGAGMGGLSAATNLAKNGKRVLLLERHNVPGGYGTSFVRGRYELEVALHELSGMGTEQSPGSLFRYLEDLGVMDHIELVRLDSVYRKMRRIEERDRIRTKAASMELSPTTEVSKVMSSECSPASSRAARSGDHPMLESRAVRPPP